MKTKTLIILLFGCLLLITGCTQNNSKKENVSIANPASVYCEENGGTLELIFDNGESYGICHFRDGSFCEEWEYYHGECSQKKEITQTDGDGKNNTQSETASGDIIMCPQDAKECPDGSYVGRTGPDCHFETCATNSETQPKSKNEETVSAMFDKYKNSNSLNTTGLTEQDIELMDDIIEQLK